MLNGGSFYDYYETADGRWLSVGSLEPQFIKQLCDELGLAELQSYGMSQNPAHQAELKQALSRIIGKKPLAQWQAIFAERDACVEPVLTLCEAADHPQIQARDMVVNVPRADGTHQRQLGFPIKFSATPCQPRYIGKALGSDSEDVLAAIKSSGGLC
jgi:crotonobetainyl-CoA:carnitine CoA-transferase CaiB-like acyl-CoA transferase